MHEAIFAALMALKLVNFIYNINFLYFLLLSSCLFRPVMTVATVFIGHLRVW